ncbi:MAG: V-type ATP synthase subunit D [Candidatus Omnitrophica bacterium]|nr:V-type ATP synthase subunit D [Candidatus Omnitrophota bacterium]
MVKVKLTKGELKRQRDSLRQYERYLPTLLLKKQQLQIEILAHYNLLAAKKQLRDRKLEAVNHWAGLLSEPGVDLKPWLIPSQVVATTRNIAGVDIPVYEHTTFPTIEYDLFTVPLWVDFALEELQALLSLEKEVAVIEEAMRILKQELRITTQRVNLFEKVKIPESREAIRLIKIYIGDQMANAVGRSKIAKRKIEEMSLAEVAS